MNLKKTALIIATVAISISAALVIAPNSLSGLADTALACNEPKLAILILGGAHTLYPRIYAILVKRALIYRDVKMLDLALADDTAAIDLQPLEPLAYLQKAEIEQLKHLDKNALADLNEAIKLDPRDPHAMFARATIFERLHVYDNAIRDYSKAIALDPTFTDAIYSRSWVIEKQLGFNMENLTEFDQKQRQKTLVANASSSRQDKSPAQVKYSHSRGLPDSTNTNGVAGTASTAPPDIIKHYQNAVSMRDSRRFKEAINELTWVIEQSRARPFLPKFLDERGQLRAMSGDLVYAINDFNAAINLGGKQSLTFFDRGYAYFKLGDYRSARKDLLQVTKLDPSNVAATEMLTLITEKTSAKSDVSVDAKKNESEISGNPSRDKDDRDTDSKQGASFPNKRSDGKDRSTLPPSSKQEQAGGVAIAKNHRVRKLTEMFRYSDLVKDLPKEKFGDTKTKPAPEIQSQVVEVKPATGNQIVSPDPELRRESLTTALASAPLDIQDSYKKYEIARQKGEDGKSLEALNRVIESKLFSGANAGLLYRQRGVLFARLGESQQAIDSLNAALRAEGENSAWVLWQRGQAYAKLNDNEQALRDLSAAIRMGIHGKKIKAKALQLRASIYDKMGNSEAAGQDRLRAENVK